MLIQVNQIFSDNSKGQAEKAAAKIKQKLSNLQAKYTKFCIWKLLRFSFTALKLQALNMLCSKAVRSVSPSAVQARLVCALCCCYTCKIRKYWPFSPPKKISFHNIPVLMYFCFHFYFHILEQLPNAAHISNVVLVFFPRTSTLVFTHLFCQFFGQQICSFYFSTGANFFNQFNIWFYRFLFPLSHIIQAIDKMFFFPLQQILFYVYFKKHQVFLYDYIISLCNTKMNF